MYKLKVKELKESLLNRLASTLVMHKFIHREQRYIRRINDDLSQSIHLNFIDSSAGISVTVHIGIRHDLIEKIAHGWKKPSSAQSSNASATWGCELGQFTKTPLRWQIASIDDVEKSLLEIHQAIVDLAIPALDQYASLERILSDFSSSSFKDWRQLLGGRALRLPLLLAVLGRPNLALNCFTEQYEILREKQDLLYQDYPKFVAFACTQFGLKNPLNFGKST